jgi:hypothetical protein
MDEELLPTHGEFHHFQLVNQEGEVPFSISVLVHYNAGKESTALDTSRPAISAEEIIEFHDALADFDGDFVKAFAAR